jgi:hypothetical protein
MTNRALLWERLWNFGFHDSWQLFVRTPVGSSQDCAELRIWRRFGSVATAVTVSSRAFVISSNHKFPYITRRCLLTEGSLHRVFPLNYSLAKHGSAQFNQQHAARPNLVTHPYRHLIHLLHYKVWTDRPVSQPPQTAIVTVRRTLLAFNYWSMRENTNMLKNIFMETPQRRTAFRRCTCLRNLRNKFYFNNNIK